MTDRDGMPAPRVSRVAAAAGLVVAAVVVAALAVWLLLPGGPAASGVAPPATASPMSTPSRTPTPTPTPTVDGIPANTAVYDAAALPVVDVFAVNAALPVDTDPLGTLTDQRATPRPAGAPVFADPAGEPVGWLPRHLEYDGTTVPVIESHENWVKVLLVGRQAVPSQGDPAQVTGWLRTQDVELTASDVFVDVSISARTVDIVRAGDAQRVATDFAWGTAETPTPIGRSYIMTTRVVPEFAYTRGHPIVYLSVQSPTLDGFGGADAAVTAFHYHDARSGQISNGCLRVDPAALAALAQLPLGTPVYIRP